MAAPRAVAFKILLKIEQDSAYSNLALNSAIREGRLNSLDSAFVSALVYGVLERKLTLDYIIKQYSKIPLRKIEIKTKIILRLGILQLLFMDKIPDSAAVNESVSLAKRLGLQKSSGFINGLLRSVTRAEEKYKLPDEADKTYFYSIKYSVPEELVRLWFNSYGELNAVSLFESLSGRPQLCARVNTLRTSSDELIEQLGREGVRAEKAPFVKDALYLYSTGSVEKLTAFKKGLFHIQDLSSQLCAAALDPKPREIMHDVCSAPGGKSFTCAQLMNNRGRVFSCDMYDHKLGLIEAGAKRLGIEIISVSKRDAAKGGALPAADKILCDVPCGGLGILSRKPEIRYKENLIDNSLPHLQYKILCESAKNLAVGGRLVYSTCTLNPAENNAVTKKFLRAHGDFEGVALTLPEGISRAVEEESYELTLMPHTAGCDGFYFAAFTRRA